MTATDHTSGLWRRFLTFALFAFVLLTALAIASSSKAAVESPPPPQVWSDKADYAPGEQVTLSGANWAPGEAVHIRVNDDAGETWRRDVDVTAAEDGTFVDQFELPTSFVAVYTVTATGAQSGTATWSFTDGNVVVRARAGVGVPLAVTFPAASVNRFNNTTCATPSAASNAAFTTNGGNNNYTNSGVTANNTQSASLAAPSPVTIGGTTYTFSSWDADSPNELVVTTTGTTGCFHRGPSQSNDPAWNVTANYLASTSTAVARTAGSDPSTFGDSLMFRATVTKGSPAVPVTTGTVKFFDGGSSCALPGPQIGADQTLNAAGQASVTTSGLAVGSHTVRACYQGADGLAASSGSISQTVNPACTAPSVTTQPSNQSVTYGSNATFSAAANGNPTPSIQWQVKVGSGSFTDISGATSTNLTVTKPSVSESGNQYRAVFTNTCSGTQTASSNAATLTVAPKAITVTPDSGQSKVYGNADLALTYTSAPPLESGDSFSGALARAAGENVGDYAINLGTLSAGDNYTLSLSGTVNFAITKKDATWTTNPNSKTYGAADPSPLTTGSGSGFLAADGVSASYSRAGGETVAGSPYHITATLSASVAGALDNYNITNDGADFTIERRPITVKANDVTRTYGNSTPAFSLALSAGTFASGEGFGDLGGPAVFDTGAPASGHQAVGVYPIDVSGLSSSNYDISYATGTDRGKLTIVRRELTVKADNKSKTYDGSPFTAFTRTITGFASGENESVISGTVAYGGSAIGAVNAGNYTIAVDVSGLSASNYTFTAQNGTLTIDKRPITVTADPKTKVFGNTDPPLTYHLTSGSLVAGDSFSGALSRVAGEGVGSYAILKNTLTAGSNYELTYVGANLTITAWNAAGSGFYAPVGVANSVFTAAPNPAPSVNPGEYWNTAKGGSTVPLKFNVYAGSVEKTSLSDILGFQASKVSCSGGTGDDAIEFVTSGNTSLRYDTTGMQWIQNWKTPSVTGDTCYRAWVTFADGSSLEAFFKLKK